MSILFIRELRELIRLMIRYLAFLNEHFLTKRNFFFFVKDWEGLRKKNMDFINRFAILRAHEYNVYTIEGMREWRKKEKAGRCRVAEDAVLITSVVVL